MSAGPCQNICTSYCLSSVDFEHDAERCWRRVVAALVLQAKEEGVGVSLCGVGLGKL